MQYNSINMNPIQAAIEELESHELGNRLSYTKLAAKYNINWSTLSQRHQGLQARTTPRHLISSNSAQNRN
jgi:hypothetical protein